MAALTSANVRLIKSWREGSVTGKRRAVRAVEIYNGSWGGASNTLAAAAFGLSVIEEITPGFYANHAYTAAPSADGTVGYLFATLGGSSAPGDVTVADTPNGMYLTVKGY